MGQPQQRNAEKDAFDYNNSISDKAKEIASLRKQLEAYRGDMSEETRAKAQTLRVSLEEAERDLQEAQYDKYISDTKDMLSDLGDDFEGAIQELINSLHLEFDKLAMDINGNRDVSLSTILGKMDEIHYEPTDELKSLLDGISGGGGTVGGIGEAVNDMAAAIGGFCSDMASFADLIAQAASVVKTVAGEIPDRDAGKKPGGEVKEPTSTGIASPGTGSVTASISPSSPAKGELVGGGHTEPLVEPGHKTPGSERTAKTPNKKANVTKAELEADGKKAYALDYIRRHVSPTKKKYGSFSDLNKRIYNNFGSKVLSTKEMKELAAGLGIKYDNAKSTGTLYKKLKSLGVKGFKVGSPYIQHGQLAFLGGEGNELQFDRSQGVLRVVGQGDKVFTAKMAKNLWEIAGANPSILLGGHSLKQDIVPVRAGNGVGDVNINMGGITMNEVNDPKAFTHNLLNAIANDRNVKGLLVNETVGRLSSNFNSLSGRKFLK